MEEMMPMGKTSLRMQVKEDLLRRYKASLGKADDPRINDVPSLTDHHRRLSFVRRLLDYSSMPITESVAFTIRMPTHFECFQYILAIPRSLGMDVLLVANAGDGQHQCDRLVRKRSLAMLLCEAADWRSCLGMGDFGRFDAVARWQSWEFVENGI